MTTPSPTTLTAAEYRQALHDTRDEAAHQRAFAAWVRDLQGKYPCLRAYLHVPNGGKRPKKAAAAMKKEGQSKGAPDNLFFSPTDDYAGLAVELKVPARPGKRKGRLSAAQSDWLSRLAGCGWQAVEAYGEMAARQAVITHYDLPQELINL